MEIAKNSGEIVQKLWNNNFREIFTEIVKKLVGSWVGKKIRKIPQIFEVICDAIWKTMRKVEKCDFEIFMVPRGGETEKYSKKNIVSKAQFYAELWCFKGQSCEKLISTKKR